MPSMRSELRRLEWLIAHSVLEVRFVRLCRSLKTGFNPSQPRDDRGRWVGDGAGNENARLHPVQGDRLSGYPIDLREESALGGHAIEEHVARSPEYLTDRVREEARATIDRGDLFRGLSIGSFTSLDSATKLVNSTVAQN